MSEQGKEMKEHTGEQVKEVKGETTKTTNNKVAKVSPSSSKELPAVLTKEELTTLDYNDFSTPARMLALAEVLVTSQLVPLKKKEDVFAVLKTGQDLGIPFMTSVSQIYCINGRTTLGVHVQKAILLKNKVVFEKIEDAEFIYSFAKKEATGLVQLGTGTIKEQPKDSLKKHIDTRTTYLFTREIKMPSGKYKTITATGSFSLSEAREAELTEKDVWIKYWRRMLDARAFTNGAREIADDLLLGILSPNELDSNYYINDSGEEIHIAEVVN